MTTPAYIRIGGDIGDLESLARYLRDAGFFHTRGAGQWQLCSTRYLMSDIDDNGDIELACETGGDGPGIIALCDHLRQIGACYKIAVNATTETDAKVRIFRPDLDPAAADEIEMPGRNENIDFEPYLPWSDVAKLHQQGIEVFREFHETMMQFYKPLPTARPTPGSGVSGG